MILPVALLLLCTTQPVCHDQSSCRQQAEAARTAGDFEAFHDLAWAAYGKGRQNDPELMLLVARAQSLSGRPGDALVMLERIAALGAPTDAATSDDFARVRALPRWPEVASKFIVPAEKEPAPPEKEREAPAKESKPPAKESKAPAKEPKPPAKKPDAPAKAPGPPAKEPEPPAKEPEPPVKAKPPVKEGRPSAKDAPLSFTTVLTPGALAYDAVSKRFVIADRRARRVAIIDEHTGQVSTLVGERGGLGDIGGMAIDPQQGDLWLVSTGEDGAPALHRVQLISGRVVSSVPLKRTADPVALAFVRGAGLVLADARGDVWKVDGRGAADRLGALEYVPEAFASDASGRLYISGGAARIGRYRVSSSLRRIDTLELTEAIPGGVPFAVVAGRLHFVVPADGRFELRSLPVK